MSTLPEQAQFTQPKRGRPRKKYLTRQEHELLGDTLARTRRELEQIYIWLRAGKGMSKSHKVARDLDSLLNAEFRLRIALDALTVNDCPDEYLEMTRIYLRGGSQ